MSPILSIIKLTWKAALRYRLFLATAGLLLAAVVALPLLIKDDGTARGFTQILLTYTLSLITVLLGFATLWLSCGVLAADIEGCQMQMVAVKPIPRWQIWLGKWLGVVSLNAVLISLAGGCVYGLLMYRAQDLNEEQRAILEGEVLVARGSLKESPADIEAAVDQALAQELAGVNTNNMDFFYVRQQIEEEKRREYEMVPPAHTRIWSIPVGRTAGAIGDDPIYLRFRFYGVETNLVSQQLCRWIVGSGESILRSYERPTAANTFHEVPLYPGEVAPGTTLGDMLEPDGTLTVRFLNTGSTPVFFPIEDGFEILYREGSFVLNYIRGLAIILFWLSLLAAVGLAAASFMSFPVACFFTVGLLIIVLSGGTIADTVTSGTVMGTDHETGQAISGAADRILLPVFQGLNAIVHMVQSFSPVDSLSSGRSITWSSLGRAFLQIVVILGGSMAVLGIVCLNRRELATAQSNQS